MARHLGDQPGWVEVAYWIDEKFAGRGITPTAVAMAVDHCLLVMGLHRLVASIRPENAASKRVVGEARIPQRRPPRARGAHRRRLAGPHLLCHHRRRSTSRASPSLAEFARRGTIPPANQIKEPT